MNLKAWLEEQIEEIAHSSARTSKHHELTAPNGYFIELYMQPSPYSEAIKTSMKAYDEHGRLRATGEFVTT